MASKTGDEGFTIADGVNFARGVRMIEDNQRIREAEQEEKDSFAAADLLSKVQESEKNPEVARQLQQQFQGYSPEVRFKAATHFAGKQRASTETVLEKFKKDYAEARGTFQEGTSMLRAGDTDGAMSRFVSIYNNNIKDGKTYSIQKGGEKGKYRLIQKDAAGNEIMTLPTTADDLANTVGPMLTDPKEAFQAYQQGWTDRKMQNVKSREKAEVFVNPQGRKIFVYDGIDPETQENKRVYEENGQVIEAPKPEDGFRLEKTLDAERKTKQELEKNDLDIKGKGLDNVIKKKHSQLLDKQIAQTDKIGEVNHREAVKKAEEDIKTGVSSEFYGRGYEVDEKKGVVYVPRKDTRGNVIEDSNGKPMMMIDKKATEKYKDAIQGRLRGFRERVKKGDDPFKVLYQLQDEMEASAKQESEKDRARYRSGGRGGLDPNVVKGMIPEEEEGASESKPDRGGAPPAAMVPPTQDQIRAEMEEGKRVSERWEKGVVDFFRNQPKTARSNADYLKQRGLPR